MSDRSTRADSRRPSSRSPGPGHSGDPLGGARVLYVGNLSRGSTCGGRLRAVRDDLGVDVVPFDMMDRWAGASRLSQRVASRLGVGPVIRSLNRALRDAARAARPDVVWIDKGAWVMPATLRALRAAGAFVVHYNPDDPFGAHRRGWRLHRRGIPLYDLCFVARPVNIDDYRAEGAQRVEPFDRSYDPHLHRPARLDPSDQATYGAPCGFVGSIAPHRARVLESLAAEGYPLAIRGHGWARDPRVRSGALGRVVRGPGIMGEGYVKALRGLGVALHFLNRENRDEQDSRTYEVPACGVCMLAEWTPVHARLFEDDIHAALFRTPDELRAKLRWLLDDHDARRRIATAGHRRITTGGHDHATRMRQLLTVVADARSPR